MIWTPYDWINKGYSFYMAAIVIIGGGHGLRIEVRHSNQPNKSKLLLYSYCFHLKTSPQIARQGTLVIKGGCGVRGHMHIKVFKRKAGLGYR